MSDATAQGHSASRGEIDTDGNSVRRIPAAERPIDAPYMPIVYVRGFAMTAAEREQVFHGRLLRLCCDLG